MADRQRYVIRLQDGAVTFGAAVDDQIRIVVGGPARYTQHMIRWAARAGLGLALRSVNDGSRIRLHYLVPNRPQGAARMVELAGGVPVEQFRRLMG